MSIDQNSLRKALGRFPTGICVITTQDQSGQPVGMTANSFTAVSLDPALVLWSIQKNSGCFDFFDQSEIYAVNILSVEQESLSNKYATKNNHILEPGSYRTGRSGNPILKHVLASFECQVTDRHEGGDHMILVAKVLNFDNTPTGEPLVYYAGQYKKLR